MIGNIMTPSRKLVSTATRNTNDQCKFAIRIPYGIAALSSRAGTNTRITMYNIGFINFSHLIFKDMKLMSITTIDIDHDGFLSLKYN